MDKEELSEKKEVLKKLLRSDGEPKKGAKSEVEKLKKNGEESQVKKRKKEQNSNKQDQKQGMADNKNLPNIPTILNILEIRKSSVDYVVKPGQICVLTPGVEVENTPEVYYMGEIILTNNLQSDIDYQLIILKKYPGLIEALDNRRIEQVLKGISIDNEDPAVLDLLAPVQLSNVSRFLNRSGGDDFRATQKELQKILEQKTIDILENRIQLWSRDKRTVAEDIFSSVNRVLESWGLQIIPEEFSVTRKYPERLYNIVLQFRRVEQIILDINDQERKDLLFKTGLLEADILRLHSMAEQESHPLGHGIFTLVKKSNAEIKTKIKSWLQSKAANSAASLIDELYLQENTVSERDIKLSEQVLGFAFHKVLLGVGEWLEEDMASMTL